MEDLTKTIMFTSAANTLQSASGGTTIQYQSSDQTLKQSKLEKGGQGQEFPAFCYAPNMNKIQMLTPTSQTNSVNLGQLSDENKTCYIAQPFYTNYVLGNQMQLGQNGTVAGIATVDSAGRLVVNKPIANTISNISFKCDVCGLMFSHLTLLNHHKRMHTESSNNGDQITVVSQGGQGLVQSQNLVNENGQSLGQIQIVATEALEQAQQAILQNSQVQLNSSNSTIITSAHSQSNNHSVINSQRLTSSNSKPEKVSKCITCGNLLSPSSRRKGTKGSRCATCLSHDNHQRQQLNRSTQIFVAPDGEIKFELGDMGDGDVEHMTSDSMGMDSSGHSIKHNAPTASSSIIPGHYPVKKRNATAVTKCQKCNGSGVIYVGGQKQKPQQQDKPFLCNICGGTFSRYSSLWSHKKLHSGEKNHICDICGLAFAKAVYLKNHSRVHTGEKPYKCNTCGMQFSQSPHLKNHERTHSGEKPYVCEVCDKGFARHATLWNHRRIHTGEKPYKCDTCGSAFSQAAHLKNHAKVHSGEKPFKCDICSAAFGDRFALKRHRGIHEKYGQTAPRQPAQPQSEPMAILKQEAPESNDGDQPNDIIM